MRRRSVHLHRADGRRVPERRADLVGRVRGGEALVRAGIGGQVGGKFGHVIVVRMVGRPRRAMVGQWLEDGFIRVAGLLGGASEGGFSFIFVLIVKTLLRAWTARVVQFRRACPWIVRWWNGMYAGIFPEVLHRFKVDGNGLYAETLECWNVGMLEN